jgi:anaerobic magnesium-protoporphyrin IX monomethyl ester cyclase
MGKALLVFSIEGTHTYNSRPVHPTAVQIGLSYIAAFLKARGQAVRLVVLESASGAAEFKLIDEAIAEHQPDLVGYTAVATQYPFIADVARHVRATQRGLFQVVGGPHVTLNPRQAIDDGFDAVCVGEGEYACADLLEQVCSGQPPTGIANLWLKRGDDVEVNPPRPFDEALDKLPIADRDVWKPWIRADEPPIHTVLLGRGCPFRCTYCCNHAFQKLATGKYTRVRTPASIVEEVAALAFGPDVPQRMTLEVETVSVYPDWAEELCDALAAFNAQRAAPIEFETNLRVTPNADFDRLCSAFARANIKRVNIGLESGSERIRRDVLKRYYSNEDVLRAVAAVRRHGLEFGLFNLIGLPGETMADFLDTARMNWLCRPDWHHTSIFYPYPGTALEQVCAEQGLLDTRPAVEGERRVARLDLPTFSREQIQRCYDEFASYVAYGDTWARKVHVLATRHVAPRVQMLRKLPGYWFITRRLGGLARRTGLAQIGRSLGERLQRFGQRREARPAVSA